VPTHALPLINGLLHAPAVHLLTSPADADLVACREAVLAALVGSLATGAPCLGREPQRRGLSLIASSEGFADRIAERLELWSQLTALRLHDPVFAHLGDGFAPGRTGGRQAGEGELLDDLAPALIIVAAGGLVLPKPATSTTQARRIIDRLRWLAGRAGAAVVLDLSEEDRRVGSPELFAPEVDAVLAIDPDRPAVHVHRPGQRAATYEPSLGPVGDMVAINRHARSDSPAGRLPEPPSPVEHVLPERRLAVSAPPLPHGFRTTASTPPQPKDPAGASHTNGVPMPRYIDARPHADAHLAHGII
jgi:hypothetical protein